MRKEVQEEGRLQTPLSLEGHPAERCRQLDRDAIEEVGIPGIILMEHASLGAARLAQRILSEGGRRQLTTLGVRILCGPGNNGGDGYAMARHLHNAGAHIEVWELEEAKCASGRTDAGPTDARRNRAILCGMGLEIRAMSHSLFVEAESADLLVDAIFGTGLSRPPEGILAEAIQYLNKESAPVLAVDIPSGLNADTGKPLGIAVEARWTVTFGLVKQGFLRRGAARFTGELFYVPIGVPRELLPPGTPAFPPDPVPLAGEATTDNSATNWPVTNNSATSSSGTNSPATNNPAAGEP